jgi:competence protein ComEC
VAGIFALAAPIRRALVARLGPGPWRRALAEGAAVTVAATLTTAPLVAFHFETFSTTTLVANLLAMPAVAPAMWLGMASAAVAQVPGLPVEALNFPNALLLAYIAQVAAWCGRPGWAELDVRLGGAGLLLAYLGIAAAALACARLSRRRRLAAVRDCRGRASRRYPRASVVAAMCAGLVAVVLWTVGDGAEAEPAPLTGFRIEVLDVGQGDAILLQPADGGAVLVDGGPPGADLEAMLEDAGVDRLAAAIVSHDQSDHAGGVEELLGRFPVARLLYGRLGADRLRTARGAGAVPVRISAGDVLRSGALRIEVLWPPNWLLAEPPANADPNQLALVLLVRWRDFSILLAADAEAEAVPLDPGPVDVLKVAHHGSEDAGLATLLDRASPALAVISVGADNPYGHPTADTLTTLARHGVRSLRTDRHGEIEIDVGPRSVEVRTGR